mmetsp:Transcript_35599/g.82679  ORF Transcript_35599/g.82679 Transcript_35599/m.82679 type:complete len:85 (-) Transcript_35599:206-460(-)
MQCGADKNGSSDTGHPTNNNTPSKAASAVTPERHAKQECHRTGPGEELAEPSTRRFWFLPATWILSIVGIVFGHRLEFFPAATA